MRPDCEHSPQRPLLRDVTLRDGLQSIPEVFTTEQKISIFECLVEAGIQDFQLTSFVNPARIPQMADAEDLYMQVKNRGVHIAVLVANLKGFERASHVGAEVIDAVLSASETYNNKNAARTTEESATEIETMLRKSENSGCTVDVSIANCFHCFGEGTIDPSKVLTLTKRFHNAGARTIWLSDTTGHAEPTAVADLTEKACRIGVQIGMHLHDTMGRAGENALAAHEAGAQRFDAVLGGLGGSPFTPAVGGNLSLETALAVFSKAGIETSISEPKLQAAREKFEAALIQAKSHLVE